MGKKKVVHVSGKRKTAVARATLRKGEGEVKINKKPIKVFKPELARLRLKEPLLIADDKADGVDIEVKVEGGGWSSQVEASRLAIAKGLVKFTSSEELEEKYLEYDRNLLVADTRRKERTKPMTHSSARSKTQKSYR